MLYADQKIRFVALLVLLLLVFSDVSHSQSGRRASKLPGPPPAAVEAPNTNSARSSGPAQQKTHLLVARQTTHKHLQTEDAVFASFIKRLNEYANIECSSIGDMKQSQAAARAKTETTDPVVILTFDIDRYAGGTIILNSQDLEIEYFLFAPHSGKKQTQGKVYFQGVGSGRLRKSNWPNGTPVKMTPEAAGIEAAESLYQWLLFSAATKKPTQ
ncbi:MAG TPA: hypothetical protein VE056_02360 [Pyrinomonadaceae bacterium]|nr:hypothetical protein [Pyrinomonadaceae bacterium]